MSETRTATKTAEATEADNAERIRAAQVREAMASAAGMEINGTPGRWSETGTEWNATGTEATGTDTIALVRISDAEPARHLRPYPHHHHGRRSRHTYRPHRLHLARSHQHRRRSTPRLTDRS